MLIVHTAVNFRYWDVFKVTTYLDPSKLSLWIQGKANMPDYYIPSTASSSSSDAKEGERGGGVTSTPSPNRKSSSSSDAKDEGEGGGVMTFKLSSSDDDATSLKEKMNISF